jgi:beta-N-acetylhexosaminidase
LPPLLIAIDQEGGQVARLGPPFTQFPGNPAMTGEEDALGFAATTASELASIGVNMNLAPVIDVAPEGFPSVMAGRIFGTDPHWVARLGGAVIDGLQSRRIMAVAKHFPGIGRTSLDSHLDRPVFEDTLESLEGFDLIPFRDAARRRVSGVMLSHIVYRRIDPQWPASLSRRIAADLLRKRLGYRGVVLTDDLEMGAITRYYDLDTAVRRIFRADIDIALICRSPELQAQAFEILVGLGGSSERARRGSERSVWRILRLKADYLQ